MQSLLLVLLFPQMLVPVSSAPASLVGPLGASRAASELPRTVRTPFGASPWVHSLRRRALAASQIEEVRNMFLAPSKMTVPQEARFVRLYAYPSIPSAELLPYATLRPPRSGGTGVFHPPNPLVVHPAGPPLKPSAAAPIQKTPVREAAARESSTQMLWTSVPEKPISNSYHQPTYSQAFAYPPATSTAAPDTYMALDDPARLVTLRRNPTFSKAVGRASPRPIPVVPDVPMQTTPLVRASGYQTDGLYGLGENFLQPIRDTVQNLSKGSTSSHPPVNPTRPSLS